MRRNTTIRLACAMAAALAAGAAPRAAWGWSRKSQINLAYQIALADAGYSPGILDGQFGPNSRMALREYTQRYFPGVNPYNSTQSQVYNALHVDVQHAVATYTIGAADAAQVGPVPHQWKHLAELTRLPYRSLADCIEEKFHCTESLLRQLNPGVSLSGLSVGQTIRVPDIQPFPQPGPLPEPDAAARADAKHAAYMVIDERAKVMRLYDRRGREMALFHCSVAKDPRHLPYGQTTVRDMVLNPPYWFNPKEWPEVHNVHQRLMIPPGPRNPVGLAWMGLNLPGYGMHGNAYPQNIGRTGSHGCFRMTNWDALRLFTMVRVGMPVKFIHNPLHPRSAGGSGPYGSSGNTANANSDTGSQQ